MSKISDYTLHMQEVQERNNWKFMDFVYDNLVSNKLSDDDINKLEETQLRASTTSKLILSNQTLNPYQTMAA